MANDQRLSTESRFFGVIAQPRSYRSIGYLLLGLPLGTMYFTVIVTGVAVGISMLVVALAGIPLLIGVWYVVRGFMRLERSLAVGMLGADIPPLAAVPTSTGGLWSRFKVLMRDRPTWKGMGYLILRFVVGTVSFTVAVSLVATSVGLAFGPIWMWAGGEVSWGSWTFDPYPWSFALVPVGILLGFVSLHVMNALASVSGRWARRALSGSNAGPESESIRIDLRSEHTSADEPAQHEATTAGP